MQSRRIHEPAACPRLNSVSNVSGADVYCVSLFFRKEFLDKPADLIVDSAAGRYLRILAQRSQRVQQTVIIPGFVLFAGIEAFPEFIADFFSSQSTCCGR